MRQSCIGAQLYTLREHLKTPEEIAVSLKKVKEIGYDFIQVSGVGPIEPLALKEILDREGLNVVVTHFSFEQIRDNFDDMVSRHKLWGCENIGVGAMPGSYRNKDGYTAFAREASALARKLKNEGLQFVYHNHRFEFEKYDDRTGMQILAEDSDAGAFGFEPDTYWIQAGGADPATWIRQLAGRIPVVHMKDMKIINDQQTMAEVGEGNLNWHEILIACQEAGVRWYLVEQDDCQGRDPFACLATSLQNLRKMGLY